MVSHFNISCMYFNGHFCNNNQYLSQKGEISEWSLLLMIRFRRDVFQLVLQPCRLAAISRFLCVCGDVLLFSLLQELPLPFSISTSPLPLTTRRWGGVPIHMASCSTGVADTCLPDATNFILWSVSVSEPLLSNETAPNFFFCSKCWAVARLAMVFTRTSKPSAFSPTGASNFKTILAQS
jgi:hypothetical protein